MLGSLIAFAAYVYLLRHLSPARVGSYAYVNPVVAVFLGWARAAEPVTTRTVIAAAVILTGVVLIVTHRSSKAPAEGGTLEPDVVADPATEVPAPTCTAS